MTNRNLLPGDACTNIDGARHNGVPGQFWFARAVLLIFAWYSIWVAFFTPMNIGIPLRLAQIAPANRNEDFGIILGSGLICAIFAAPLWGTLSDRTYLKWGKRRPYVMVGLLGCTLSLVLMTTASTALELGFAWCIMQSSFYAATTAIMAFIIEATPSHRLGVISSITGVSISLAPTGSLAIAVACGENFRLLFLSPLALAGLGLTLITVLIKDTPAQPHPSQGLRTFFGKVWINPIRNWNFGLAALSRMALFFGFNFFTAYRVYLLIDRLGITQSHVAKVVLAATALNAATAMFTALSFGWLSDRTGLRKPFVRLSCIILGVGLAITGFSESLMQFYLGSALFGAGIGSFHALETAWAASVRPAFCENGKLLGLLFSSGMIGQIAASFFAPIVFATASSANQGYAIIFSAGTIACLLAALIIQPIREIAPT